MNSKSIFNYFNFEKFGAQISRASLPGVMLLSFFASSCSLYTSQTSITNATLRRVQKILDACEASAVGHAFDADKCIQEYAARENTLVEAVLMDGYGRSVFVEVSRGCASVGRLPYSAGPNGIDECGRGDDVSLL